MARKQDSYSALSLKERAVLFNMMVNNGVTNRNEIIKLYNRFDEGGDTDSPQAEAIRQKAYQSSVDTKEATTPIVELTKEKRAEFTRELEQNISKLQAYNKVKNANYLTKLSPEDVLLARFVEGNYDKTVQRTEYLKKVLKEGCMEGSGCTYHATGHYGPKYQMASSQEFVDTDGRGAFKEVPKSESKPGDIVISFEDNGDKWRPHHTLMFSKWDDNGNPRYNASRGGNGPTALRWDQLYNITDSTRTYRFIGTPEDREEWSKANSFDNGGTKSLLEAGASFIPIVGSIIDIKNLIEEPSWENAGWAALSVGSDLLGATAIKGLAKSAKAAKALKVSKAIHQADTASEYARLAKKKSAIEKTLNPKKISQAAGDRGRSYFNDLVAKRQLQDATIAFENADAKAKLAAGAALAFDVGTNTTQTLSGNTNTSNSFGPGGGIETPDKKHVEDVVRTTRGATGDFVSLDPLKVDFEQLGYLYDAWRVMHGSTKHIAPKDENYTGVAMKGIGVKTDDGLGFVSQKDLEDKLGYDPVDFVDAYVYGGIPFEELGVFKKDISPERHLIRSKVEKEENRGNKLNTYQVHKDTLNLDIVNYLDSLLNNGLVDYYSTNTTYKESPFNIGDSGIIYDGNNTTIALAKLPNGQTVRKAIDVFDTDPTEWNYDVGPLAKSGLGFINDNTTPFIMTSPWYLPDSSDWHTRLMDVFGIIVDENFNVIGNKGDVNGVKWDLHEALQWLNDNPDLTKMPEKPSDNKFAYGGSTESDQSYTDYPIDAIAPDGNKYSDIIAARENDAYNALLRKGYSIEDARRLSPILTAQSLYETGWKLRDPNHNYAGYLSGNGKLKYESADEFWDSHLDNLSNRWSDWDTANSVEDYYNIVNQTHLGLKSKKEYDTYKKEHPNTFIYSPEWENTGYRDNLLSTSKRVNAYLDRTSMNKDFPVGELPPWEVYGNKLMETPIFVK